VLVESSARKRGSRFVCISDRESNSGRSRPSLADGLLGWRLLAPNNRTLGRSTDTYETVAACQDAAWNLRAGHARLEASVTVGADGRWHWSIALDGAMVASSASAYFRRMEVNRAVRLFLATVGTTDATFAEVRHLGPHGPRALGVVGLTPLGLSPAGAGWS
jgi:hypothetical protein